MALAQRRRALSAIIYASWRYRSKQATASGNMLCLPSLHHQHKLHRTGWRACSCMATMHMQRSCMASAYGIRN